MSDNPLAPQSATQRHTPTHTQLLQVDRDTLPHLVPGLSRSSSPCGRRSHSGAGKRRAGRSWRSRYQGDGFNGRLKRRKNNRLKKDMTQTDTVNVCRKITRQPLERNCRKNLLVVCLYSSCADDGGKQARSETSLPSASSQDEARTTNRM